MSKFRYLITNPLDSAVVYGTNDREAALGFTVDPEYTVIDTEEGLVLMDEDGESTPIQSLSD